MVWIKVLINSYYSSFTSSPKFIVFFNGNTLFVNILNSYGAAGILQKDLKARKKLFWRYG